MAGSVLVGCGEAAQGESTAAAVASETAAVTPLEETPEPAATQPAPADVTTIQVEPEGIAVDSATGTVYVANDTTISVIRIP